MKMYMLGHPDMPVKSPENGMVGVLDGAGVLAVMQPENTVATVEVPSVTEEMAKAWGVVWPARTHFVSVEGLSVLVEGQPLTAARLQSMLDEGLDVFGMYGETLDRILMLPFTVDIKDTLVIKASKSKFPQSVRAGILSRAVECSAEAFASLLAADRWNRHAMFQAALMAAAAGKAENMARLLLRIEILSPLSASEAAKLKTARSISGESSNGSSPS